MVSRWVRARYGHQGHKTSQFLSGLSLGDESLPDVGIHGYIGLSNFWLEVVFMVSYSQRLAPRL